MKKFYFNRMPFCFSDEPKGDPPKGDPPKTFTQEEINQIIAKEKRGFQEKQSELLKELNQLKSKTSLTEQEKSELETKIKNYEDQLLTKEEIARRDKEKLEKQLDEERKGLSSERDLWKTRFTQSTIRNALIEAAVTNKVINPQHIISLLEHSTYLEPIKDSDGKETGSFDVKIKFQDTDKAGKPITLDLDPKETVKRMADMDAHRHLFQLSGSGGAGGNNVNPKNLDINKLAREDPAKYREMRAKGLIKL